MCSGNVYDRANVVHNSIKTGISPLGGFDEAKENVEAVYSHFKIQIKQKRTGGRRYFWGGFRLMFGDFLSWPRFALQLKTICEPGDP